MTRINPRIPDDLAAESHFVFDCHLDSLDLMEFVARIEQDFGILIPDEDIPEFISLEATAKYIQRRLA